MPVVVVKPTLPVGVENPVNPVEKATVAVQVVEEPVETCEEEHEREVVDGVSVMVSENVAELSKLFESPP